MSPSHPPATVPGGKILLVDDDRALREMAAGFLRSLGHEVDDVATLEQARARIRARPFELVLADLILEHGTGLDLLAEVRRAAIPCEVIIMTGHGGVESAVQAIREGAYDYVTKPLSLTRLALDVGRALEKHRLEQDVARLAAAKDSAFGGITAASAAMRPVVSLLRRAANSDSNLLLLGESGTGKEVAARAVHEHSRRAGHPFVAVHCGALPGELLESELFGHVRGSFTGADRERKGLFLAADGGTLFLDEVGTAPARVQVGLLRALQERRVRPVGAEKDLPVDVRIVAATNADLDAEMAEGRFRPDLYYRLATFVVQLPPLRERREDIPLLVGPLLEDAVRRSGRKATISPRALARLAGYDWPGNVRELAHLLERAVLLAEGSVIREQDLPLPEPAEPNGAIPTLEEVERRHIEQVLARCGGNKVRAARLLGIPRPNLYRKLERYGLEPGPVPGDPVPSDEPPAPPAPAAAGGAAHAPASRRKQSGLF
ncbi:MAG: sigma-54 dependent transcriptional regulator [Acidobacteria bacterium]|jgi:two-component system response regulator HydG|nr:sigma-54 dependent transcriptional regulator [Acidobacteriota bacterium]